MLPYMPLHDLASALRHNAKLPEDQAEATPPQDCNENTGNWATVKR